MIQERRTELHKKCAKSITDREIEELIVAILSVGTTIFNISSFLTTVDTPKMLEGHRDVIEAYG